MKIHQLIENQIDHTAIDQWMRQNDIAEYEVNADNSVTINQSAQFDLGMSPLPFAYITAVNGDAIITFLNNSSSKVNKLIRAVRGHLEARLESTAPLLSIGMIKGVTSLQVELWEEDEEEDEADSVQLPEEVIEQIRGLATGATDLLQLQDTLIDMGFAKLART